MDPNIFPFSSFKNNKLIGRGGFGTVYRAEHDTLGDVALKTLIPNGELPERDTDILKNEAEYLRKFQHPCIVRLFGLIVEENNYSLVLEYVHFRSASDFLHANQKMVKMPIKIKFLRDIVDAMAYLHSRSPPALHLDLKADNILISRMFKAKVSDFGLCEMKRKSKTLTKCLPPRRKCTVYHTAPEIWENINTRPDTSQDVYAFGVTMWEICTEDYPFGERCDTEIIKNAVKNGQRPDLQTFNESIQPKYNVLNDIVDKCWRQEAATRPTFEVVKEEIRKLFNSVTLMDYSEAVNEFYGNNHEKHREISRDDIMEEFKRCKTSITVFDSEREIAEDTGASFLQSNTCVSTDIGEMLHGPIQRQTMSIANRDDKDLIRQDFIGEEERQNLDFMDLSSRGNSRALSDESITIDIQEQRRQQVIRQQCTRDEGRERDTLEQGRTDGSVNGTATCTDKETDITPSTALDMMKSPANINVTKPQTNAQPLLIPLVVDEVMAASLTLDSTEPLSNIGSDQSHKSLDSTEPLSNIGNDKSHKALDSTDPLSNIGNDKRHKATPNAVADKRAISVRSESVAVLPNNTKDIEKLKMPETDKTKVIYGKSSSSNDEFISNFQTQLSVKDARDTQRPVNTCPAVGDSPPQNQRESSSLSTVHNSNICDIQKGNQIRSAVRVSPQNVEFKQPSPFVDTSPEKLDPESLKKEYIQNEQELDTNKPIWSPTMPIGDNTEKLIQNPKDIPQINSQPSNRTRRVETKLNIGNSQKHPDPQAFRQPPNWMTSSSLNQSLTPSPTLDAVPLDASGFQGTVPELRRSLTQEQTKPTEFPSVLKHSHSSGGFTEISGLSNMQNCSFQIGDCCTNIINSGIWNSNVPEREHLSRLCSSEPLTESSRPLNNDDKKIIEESIGKRWKEFARELGLTDVDIDAIDHDYDIDGLKEKVHQVIVRWEGSRAGEANIKNLARVLYKLEEKDVAHRFK